MILKEETSRCFAALRRGHLCYPCRNGDCPCPSTCVTCESEHFCKDCIHGFYGVACSKTCKSHCKNNICVKFSGLCEFCENGYFLNDDRLCDKCPIHCWQCTTAVSCSKCATGYRGKKCDQVCTNCKPKTPCEQNEGFCSECDDGLSGLSCNTTCNPKCKYCQRLKKDTCITCSHDRYGDDCKNTCSRNCIDATCNGTEGTCTLGCSVGYWGTTCNKTCHASCRDRLCSRVDGHCTFIHQTSGLRVNLAFAAVPALVLAVVVAFFIIYLRRSGRCSTYCVRCQEGPLASTNEGAVDISEDESEYERINVVLLRNHHKDSVKV